MDRIELEYRLIYSTIVAGKSAKFADMKCRALMGYIKSGETPFEMLKRLHRSDKLTNVLKEVKTGNYSKLSVCLAEITNLNPETCTIEELENCHGIGPKTSRFFILWTRPKIKHAALDTHILKFLRSLGIDAPKSTPQSKSKYEKLEKVFLAEAEKRNMTARELDSAIWDAYSNGRVYE